jgi:hypothetical protein
MYWLAVPYWMAALAMAGVEALIVGVLRLLYF